MAGAQIGKVEIVSCRPPIVDDPAQNIFHRHAPSFAPLVGQRALIEIAAERDNGFLPGRDRSDILGHEMGQHKLASEARGAGRIDDLKPDRRARSGRLDRQGTVRREDKHEKPHAHIGFAEH